MRSMTGYSYIEDPSKNIQITMRSLNFKYLDIFINTNLNQNILLEEKIKEKIKKLISRGKIEVYIYFKNNTKNIRINRKILEKYIFEIKNLAKEYNLEYDLKLNNLLGLDGVIYKEDLKSEELILSLLDEALKKLLDFKEKAGEDIRLNMVENLNKVKENILKIKKIKPDKNNLQEENKYDISEEVSLIGFYLEKLNKTINSKKSEPKGKIIDFLTQELLRELNTASSKIVNKEIANLVLESKILIDRIREQAQNVE